MSGEGQNGSTETLREGDQVDLTPFCERMEDWGFDTREPSILEVVDLEGMPSQYHRAVDKVTVPIKVWRETSDEDDVNQDFYIFESLARMFQYDARRLPSLEDPKEYEEEFERIEEGWERYQEISYNVESLAPKNPLDVIRAEGMLKTEENLENKDLNEIENELEEKGEIPDKLREWISYRRERNKDLDIAFPYFVASAALDMEFQDYKDVEEDLEGIEGFDDDYSSKYRNLMTEYQNKRDEKTQNEALKEMVERHMNEISSRQMMAR